MTSQDIRAGVQCDNKKTKTRYIVSNLYVSRYKLYFCFILRSFHSLNVNDIKDVICGSWHTSMFAKCLYTMYCCIANRNIEGGVVD